MKELVRWIFTELAIYIVSAFGAVGCSRLGIRLIMGMTLTKPLISSLYGLLAFVLFLLAIGFLLTIAIFLHAAVDINSEILREIKAKK